jgi:hypothetical protein
VVVVVVVRWWWCAVVVVVVWLWLWRRLNLRIYRFSWGTFSQTVRLIGL